MKEEKPEKASLSREEAAHVLGISVRLLDRFVQEGRIPSKKLGGRRVFVHEQLLSWLNSLEAA